MDMVSDLLGLTLSSKLSHSSIMGVGLVWGLDIDIQNQDLTDDKSLHSAFSAVSVSVSGYLKNAAVGGKGTLDGEGDTSNSTVSPCALGQGLE